VQSHDCYGTAKMSNIRIWVIILAVTCGADAMPGGEMLAPAERDPRNMIYLVNHGWHAGIVLQHAGGPNGIWPAAGDFPDAQYLEVGWGDMDYYQTPNAHMGHILMAALLPTSSVLHIVGFNGPVQAYFPHSEIIEIELSSAGFEKLSGTIVASFARDKAGNIRPLGHGLYGNSRFFRSRETYHLFNTCNVWTARMLRSAGLPITPARATTVENLMSQARKSGSVLQSGLEPSE
jgi:uncharacterized protein (TIGR02117 family)